MNTKFLVLFIMFALGPLAWPPSSTAQISIIPGSSARGDELFRQKGCVQCHSFSGTPQAQTPMLLAAALWNHSPEMWRAQKARNVRPLLDSIETADLFAYFFSLAYFRTPGDATRGALVFQQKSCSRCHETVAANYSRGRRLDGPPISTWSKVDEPLEWAERMWNHSQQVYTEVSANGLAWPEFSTKAMIDLLAYLRGVPESRSHSAVFQPGDPEKGRITFEGTCETCHSFGSRTAKRNIDLLKKPGPDGLTGYVTAMWNHAPLMHQRAGAKFPILGPGDMSNLVAYLFAQRYFYENGDVARGAKVFEAKNCATCHERQRAQTGAPDLTMATERYSPITISASLWRHGPAMLETMQKDKVSWPEFSGPEMSNLIAYLNSRLILRVVRPGN